METSNPKFVGCTIASRNYLAQANVLARSFLRHHPLSRFVILIVDQSDGRSTREDGVELLSLSDIGLARDDRQHMPVIYDVTEFSTAVKPWLLASLLEAGLEAVMYLDPDIEVFAPLDDLAVLAGRHIIVLTPHVTEAIPRDGRQLSESDILGSGIYNLGFITIGKGSEEFLAWWKTRLRRECVIDQARMRFTDQRWIDFVPGLFPHFIVRDPTCNVAYWNLHSRRLVWQDDHYEVNGEQLRFFHFSGYDPDKPDLLSKHQGLKPRILFSEHPDVARICHAYREQLLADDFLERTRGGYGFDYLPDGLRIDRHVRRAYRDALLAFEEGRADLGPPDPFASVDSTSFILWLNEPMNAGSDPVTRYMMAVHSARADLRADFPDPLGTHAAAFHAWFLNQGRFEERVNDALVPLWSPRMRRQETDIEIRSIQGDVPLRPVTVVGYFRAELGVGEAARLLLAGLEAAAIPYQALNYGETINRQEHPFSEAGASATQSDVIILCINADQTPVFAEKMGSEFFEGRYTIGVWFWEVDQFPSSLHRAFSYVDEVWLATDFMRDALLKTSPRPVYKFQLPAIERNLKVTQSLAKPSQGNRFTFFFNFDFMSVFDRKNPLGAIEAFSRAFAPGKGPLLVIKTINGDKRPLDWERLRLAAASHPDIRVVDGYVSAEETEAMMSACDCYVSLHRSEGYGLTLAEAMSLGKPVVATGYSGNLDFMTPENSYLCSYELRAVGEGHEPYPPSAYWAEPNLQEASSLLRHIFENPEEAHRRGVRAAQDMAKKAAPALAGDVILQRLQRIRSSVGQWPKKRDAPADDASSITTQLHELGATLEQNVERASASADLKLSLREAKDKVESIRALHRYRQAGLEKMRANLERAEREVWDYKVKRADAAARALQNDERLKEIEGSAVWKMMKPIRKLFVSSRKKNPGPTKDVVFMLDLPVEWKTQRSKLLIEGWCFARRDEEIVGVRAKIQRQGRFARYGIERADVWRAHNFLQKARFSGFSIDLPLPIGTHHLSLQAIAQGKVWETFFETEVTRSASSAS